MTSLVIVFALIAVLSFLYALNLYLRGSAKQLIQACLAVALVASVIASFFVLGWKWGLLALICPTVLIALSKPVAALIACKVLGYRTGEEDGQGETDVIARIAAGENLETVMTRVSKESENRRQRISEISRRAPIASVLGRYGVPLGQFHEVFDGLWRSALHDIAWEIVSKPSDLETLLRMKREGKGDDEIWAHFRGLD